ncbi:50S ribosomal protein L1 [Patescibacteria group bacterium]|nr:50S ribosomal protein L1 [Patescibacteria group bacterium]
MRSKKYQTIKEKINKDKTYTLEEAISFIKENPLTKFDETIELHIRLGINPRKTEQQVRGIVSLPSGTVKKKRIAAFVSPDKEKEAKEAGADLVGGTELIEKIKTTNKCDFDLAIAEPDLMKNLTQIAKILGPRGLMPNPKTGTVTTEIKKTIKELQKGKISFKNDAGANLHQPVGKISWTQDKIKDNIEAFLDAVNKTKPGGVKKAFIQSIVLSSTMGPGIKISL